MKKYFKWFYNVWYRFFPPEMLDYTKHADGVPAKVIRMKDGSYGMQMKGEKYVQTGIPRGHILLGPLAKMKHKLKNMVFNQVFAELEKMSAEHETDMMPPEHQKPPVRELYRVLLELENAEVTPDMKGRIKLIRKVLTFFLQEDDAYCLRFQWVMERLDMKKIKLTDADKYFFRAKYFKVDHSHFDY
jgi:hypothetical protein